jgi:peptide subunit release factor 1 (eRF1)
MITRQQIDHLLGFRDGEHLVTSCYLSLDRSKMPAQMLKICLKDLLQNAARQLQVKAGSHKQRESLRRDLEDIDAFVMSEIPASRHKAVAIFSCAGEKFWQAFGLPRLVRNLLIAEHVPYLRPLTAILAEYHRFCVALVGRTRAQIFEVYLGEILERNAVISEVPRRVHEGGFRGRDERHIERRHVNAVHQHFRRVSDELLRLFRHHRFDRLILGGQRDLLREFKQELHPNLRARWGGDFHAEPSRITGPEVLRESLEIEGRLEWEHELRIAGELIQKAEAGELAVRGVSATLAALERGAAETLLVEDGFELPGYACFQCHFVSLEPRECPHCRHPLGPCADVVDEAIELALQRNCQIEHLQGPTPLHEGGRIGALLRYQAA